MRCVPVCHRINEFGEETMASLEIQDVFEPYYDGREANQLDGDKQANAQDVRRSAKTRLSERPAWERLEKPLRRETP
ncbi:MAG: hypothetical protein JNL61_17800 [Rhizobiaceae bacterium]|nr:hypothetical protein [Rhizobiaceae bacterium]